MPINKEHSIIKGDIFDDSRGALVFFNEFAMQSIVRMYEIIPSDINIIRAWQAHKKESKWFYCSKGAFIIKLIKIDDFNNPSHALEIIDFELNEKTPQVLSIPGGYANGFKALSNDSKLTVYSNFSLEQSKKDDYRFNTNKWITTW